MKDIVIIGAGGFGREIKCLIDDINDYHDNVVYNIIGFIDDGIQKGKEINGVKVLGGIDFLKNLDKEMSLVFGIGNPKIKSEVYMKTKNFNFPKIIHPSVSLSGDKISIGKGSVICKGTILTCNIEISDFVTINLQCTIGHDVKMNNFISIMPGVNISGEVTLQESVYIGTGAKIINQLEIGKKTVIGAGAVVSKSIPENCTAVGIPAKVIKYND